MLTLTLKITLFISIDDFAISLPISKIDKIRLHFEDLLAFTEEKINNRTVNLQMSLLSIDALLIKHLIEEI